MTETGAKLDEASLRLSLRDELTKRTRSEAPKGLGKASAVLVPLFERDGHAHVWLVRRAQGMRNHSGQVAFPGGKRDSSDESLLATALREAEEEVALRQSDVEVLGALDDLVTFTGYVITPYVGWVRADFTPVPNEDEVARVFAAPLRTFLEETTGIFPRVGWRIDGELVWGATAAIVRGFLTVIREARGERG
jgi:8-oxo-dGTP pyrophosphatase MutT (NUDIX family)